MSGAGVAAVRNVSACFDADACHHLPSVLASERERGDMRVLTDDPAIVAEFFPGAQADTWDDRDLPSPDRELVDALGLSRVRSGEAGSSNGFWSRIILISDTERSQFDAVEHLLGAGYTLPGPVASMALSGRRFHGQRRREWVGARGNVHLTVALPTHVSTEHVGAGLSMLPAVAAVDAIAQASDGAVHPAIKWVNDIEIAGRKVGGVLTAAHITGRRIDDVLWGIGINVAIAPEIHPTVFVPATTCVHAEPKGERVTVPRLFWALIRAIEHRYTELIEQGPSGLFAAYRASSLVVGRSVSVWNEADCADNDPARWGPPLAEGIVADIARDLSLGLEGRRDRVSKGRLAVRALRPRSVGGIR